VTLSGPRLTSRRHAEFEGAADFTELAVGEDAVDHDRIGDGRHDLQLITTPQADQGRCV
jgi:hypothetical protein